MHRAVGVADEMVEVGEKVFYDHLVEQHVQFYTNLPFAVIGAVDQSGDVWATLRAGNPGFLDTADPRRLRVDLPQDSQDPVEAGLNDGDAIAILGIELHSRRRNRVNGTVRRDLRQGFHVEIEQAFGNCPAYIHGRDVAFFRELNTEPCAGPVVMSRLEGDAEALLRSADTLFVASYTTDKQGRRHVDVSHRGGPSGFVRIGDDGNLTIPDFSGNRYFNTLGNIVESGKAGLLFVDFAGGGLLHVSGDAEVILDGPEIASFEKAERLWRVRPRHLVWRPAVLPLRWQDRVPQPAAPSWKPYQVAEVRAENALVRSFILKPGDGGKLPAFKAGQHLPIRLHLPGEERPTNRSYTISSASAVGGYRISVRRDGLVSTYLHGLEPGALIEARTPDGAFTINADALRPAVLLAGGIGITPMLAFAGHLVSQGKLTGRYRQTLLVHSIRNEDDRMFDHELATLVEEAGGALRVTRFVTNAESVPTGDRIGLVTMDALSSLMPFGAYDFYLCGPAGFMQAMYDGLRDQDVPDHRIFAEAFGPSSLQRRTEGAASTAPPAIPAGGPVPVLFTVSGRTATWTKEAGTLLDLAEQKGLYPDYQCRSGSCGSCRARLVSGAVAYPSQPAARVEADEVLICCAVPAGSASTHGLSIEL